MFTVANCHFRTWSASNMHADTDQQSRLVESVAEAYAEQLPLHIIGSGSKTLLTEPIGSNGRSNIGRLLSIAEHSGVTDYRPGSWSLRLVRVQR